MVAIETDSLGRRFGSVTAVEDLDLEVRKGEVFGFLGPNGAGKSTTINMLLGFVPPTAGSATVLGHDVVSESLSVRQKTGVLPEDFGVYDRLTARKHVRFAIDCKGADDDPDDLLSRVGLEDAADRKAGGFSTGMRQRVAFAMALAGEPDLLILDEPSSGLDPNGAREMREIVREEVDRGATVFFSSHVMEQVEAICDRVGVMRGGRLVACDSIGSLKGELDVASRLVISIDRVPEGLREELLSLEGVSAVRIDGTEIEVALSRAGRKTAALDAVERSGVEVVDVSTEEPSLEDLFEALTAEPEAVRA